MTPKPLIWTYSCSMNHRCIVKAVWRCSLRHWSFACKIFIILYVIYSDLFGMLYFLHCYKRIIFCEQTRWVIFSDQIWNTGVVIMIAIVVILYSIYLSFSWKFIWYRNISLFCTKFYCLFYSNLVIWRLIVKI